MGVPLARVWIGGTPTLFAILALFASLRRARRFPDEARSWRCVALALAAQILSGFVLVVLRGGSAFLEGGYLISWGFQFLSTLLLGWAVLRLPLATKHPEYLRVHVLGALLFGSSLALLFWILGFWQAGGVLSGPERSHLATMTFRAALLGGVVIYQVVDTPSRLRGPLAWVLGAVTLGILPGLLSFARISAHPEGPFPGAAGFISLYSLGLAMAALHPGPVEGATDSRKKWADVLEGLIYLPYMISAMWLLHGVIKAVPQLMVPMLGFLAVTSLLVVHQFVLLREVRLARDDLDLRVQERTLALENTQALMLRTERMNSLGLLGAGLAHDLSNALMGISASVELLQDEMGQGRPLNGEHLIRIQNSVQRSAALGQRLMAFVRREAEVALPMDLGLFLEEERDLLRMLLAAGMCLEMDVEAGNYPILAARGQLEQLLVNLVANARDAITPKGKVRVGLSRCIGEDRIDWARLLVEDDGSGMTPEVLDQLFQPLFTTKSPGKGTGLGLLSVKTIVEGLGGRIEVKSRLGCGTAFILWLPLRP